MLTSYLFKAADLPQSTSDPSLDFGSADSGCGDSRSLHDMFDASVSVATFSSLPDAGRLFRDREASVRTVSVAFLAWLPK